MFAHETQRRVTGQASMLRSMQRCLSGSRDTSQGMWVWLPAVVWLLYFVARLVRQLRLIPRASTRLVKLTLLWQLKQQPLQLQTLIGNVLPQGVISKPTNYTVLTAGGDHYVQARLFPSWVD